MKTGWFHSITSRLVIFTVLSVMVSVLGIAAFSGSKFYAQLESEYQAEAQRTAAEAANSIRGSVEFWLSSVSIVMHNIAEGQDKQNAALAETFLRSNTEFVAFQILNTKGSTETYAISDRGDDVRFQAQPADQVGRRIKAFNQDIVKKAEARKLKLFAFPADSATGLPVMTVGLRFESADKQTRTWGVLTIWQTRILKALPHSDGSFGVVLDQKGNIMMSPLADIEWGRYKSLLESMHAAGAGTATTSVMNTADGHTIVAGQSAIGDLGMRIAIIKDATASVHRIRMILGNGLALTSIYVLIMVLVCYLVATGITSKLKNAIQATKSIAAGDFNTMVPVTGRDEVSELGNAVNSMSSQIKDLLASRVEAARQEKELETARLVQGTFFPKGKIKSPIFEIQGQSIAASECGGDWWSHFTVGDTWEVLVIADATGHGAGAALVTAMAYSGCMTINEWLVKSTDGSMAPSPSRILGLLNAVMWGAGNGTTSMTSLVFCVNSRTGELTFANGGHNPPVVISGPGDTTRSYGNRSGTKQVDRQVFSLMASGDPPGFGPDPVYSDKVLQLRPGDKIVAFTDGILENCDSQDQEFGKGRLNSLIRDSSSLGAEELSQVLMDGYAKHVAGVKVHDDATIVVIQVRQSWEAERQSSVA